MAFTEAVATRMLRTTIELRSLEAEMRAALVSTPGAGQAPAAPAIDLKIAAEFRDALDGVRHALWLVREAEHDPEAATALMGYRMTRVAQMLTMLRAASPAALDSPGFIEQVQAVAALTLEKHLAEKTPA